MSDPDSDLFAFNPGKNKYIFDPSHPYFTVEDRYKVAKENNFGFPTPPKPTAPLQNTNIVSTNILEAKQQIEIFKNSLNKNELDTILAYTNGEYDFMNALLRGGDSSINKDKLILIKELNKTLIKVLNKAPKFKTTTYRGINFYDSEKYNLFISKLEKNQIFTDKGFMSTTYDKKVSLDYRDSDFSVFIEIKGKNGVLIEPLSTFDFEKEVLFNSKSKFKINSINKGTNKTTIQIIEL